MNKGDAVDMVYESFQESFSKFHLQRFSEK